MRARPVPRDRGFTLLEVMVVVAIVSILSALAGTNYLAYLERARVVEAVSDIKNISTEIAGHLATADTLPANLGVIGYGGFLDPWGNPYQYLPFPPGGKKPKGARKDKFLVPINSTYDLYSMGEDGATVAPLTAKKSRDDVIRANDGSFMGLARNY